MNSGIYIIKNNINNKQYIGSAVNLQKRWINHLGGLRNNVHHNTKLQHSFNKYGEKSFEFIILEKCSKDILIEKEQYYIDTIKPYYNLNPVAGNRLGTRHSKETREKMSKDRKGLIPWNKGKKTGPLTKEHRKKVVAAGKKALIAYNKSKAGKHLTDEHKQKVSKALTGRKFTEEHKRKLSEARIRYIKKCESGACPI